MSSAEPIVIYPLLKKSNVKLPENIEETTQEDIDRISDHLTKQLIHNLVNHKLQTNIKFFHDLQFIGEVVRSSMMRNLGMYHPLQDLIDDIVEGDDVEEEPEEISEET